MSTSVQHNNRLSWHVSDILQHGLKVELGQVLGAHAEGAGAGDGLRVGVAAVGDHVAGVGKTKLGGLGPEAGVADER